MTELKRQVKYFAFDNNLSISKIAEMCDIGYSTFCAKLNSTSDWKIHEARSLADILGISLDEFEVMASKERG